MKNRNILRNQYTVNDRDYQLKIPMKFEVFIPDNDCVRLISQFVEEMGLTALYGTYERMPSEKYASPAVMLKILLYAYHERNEISSRVIEKNFRRDINYMYLLEGAPAPEHATIARFRSEHFAKCSQEMLSHMTHLLYELDQITDTEVFIDGTKIEADANRYTFVWKKSVTKHQARHLQRTALLVEDIIQRYDLKPFVEQMKESLAFRFKRIVADAGYESEENLKYLEKEGIEAYIKPANYEQIGTKKLATQIGKKENMSYDADEDCYICHNGKKIRKVKTRLVKTGSGYLREETHYRCRDCDGCPYRVECMPGKNWKRPVEKRFKKLVVSKEFERLRKKEYELIETEEGKKLRMNRSIQAEGGFGDIKGDSEFTRFLCRGKENVMAEYILFAMAHNLGWLHSRIQNDKLDLHLYELKEEAA